MTQGFDFNAHFGTDRHRPDTGKRVVRLKRIFNRAVSFAVPALAICTLLISSYRATAEETTGKPKPTVHVRMNIAHRGASFVMPENTLATFREAIKAGADGAEGDVYRSADGVVFLAHDGLPKRTIGGNEGDLTKMTFEQIRTFDAGSWKGEQFKGEKVPTLDEYLKLLKGTTCHPVIEIKQSGIEADVLEIVRKNVSPPLLCRLQNCPNCSEGLVSLGQVR